MPPAAAAGFANTLVAYWGVQANAAGSQGQAADISRIQVSGGLVDDNFATDFDLDTLSTWTIVATVPNSIWVAGPTPKYWVNWTTPDFGYSLVHSTNSTW